MPKCNLCGIDFEVNQVKRLQEGDTAILICNDCEHELQGALASKSDAKRYLAQLEKNPIIEQEQEEILVSFIEKHGSVFSVPRILSYHNLSEAAIVFAQHKIDTEEIFETLTDEELQSIGIMELGTRKKILALIKQRNAEKMAPDPGNGERGTQEQTSATAQVSEHQEKQNQPPHEPDTNVTVQAPAQEKAGGGVWAVVGVLIVIVLGIIIIGSL
jgi:hypothetical protein